MSEMSLSASSVSIVMPCLNSEKFISEALTSIVSQGPYEVVVMDGGSTDRTLDIVNEFSDKYPRVKCFSETDLGPADAVNKAIRLCKGLYIGWLNSDDVYLEGAINRTLKIFESPCSPVMVYGNAAIIDADGTTVGLYPTESPQVGVNLFQDRCFICQPTVFIKRTVPIMIGYLDTGFRTAFDFDYWLRVFKAFPGRIGFIPEVQAKSRWHSAAISFKLRRFVAIEALRVLKSHLDVAPLHWALSHLDEVLLTDGVCSRDYLHDFLADVRPVLGDKDLAILEDIYTERYVGK